MRDAAFLFRTDQGRIGIATWWRGTAILAAPLAVLTGLWLIVKRDTHHDLSQTPLLDWAVAATYAYLIAYTFAIILIAISFYNLSAKRWRDRGRPAALAGLVPLFALFSGAAHWLQPQVAEVIPAWTVIAIDLLLAGFVLWTLVELGFQGGAGTPGAPR